MTWKDLNYLQVSGLYCDEKNTVRQVAQEIGASEWKVYQFIRSSDLKRNRQSDYGTPGPSRTKLVDAEELRRLYEDELLTIEQIAKKCSVGVRTVHKRLREYGIPTRLNSGNYEYVEQENAWRDQGTRRQEVCDRVRQRDGYRCGCCGGHGFPVHHILPRASHPELTWDEDNLMTICEPCHGLIHWGHTLIGEAA